MSLQSDLHAAVAKVTADSAILHQIVHGDVATTVATEGGPVKSAAKSIADNEAAISASRVELDQKLADAAASASAAAGFAGQAEGSALDAAARTAKIPDPALANAHMSVRVNESGTAYEFSDGGGDVSGPTSAADGDLVRFDGATGKLLKGGGKIQAADIASGVLGTAAGLDAAAGGLGGLLRADGDGSGLTGISTADQTARDQIALANLRLMLSSSVISGALVQGYQWELSDDSWGTTSTGETMSSSPHNLVGRTSGSVISGNVRTDYPAANAFDGINTGSPTSAIGITNASPMWLGKDWGSGTTKVIDGFVLDSQYNQNWSGNNGSTITVELYGSNALPSSAADGTRLYDVTGIPNSPGVQQQLDVSSGVTTSNAYRYHWISLTSSQGEKMVGECTFYEQVPVTPGYYFNAGGDMTLSPPNSVSVSSPPAFMVAYFLWKDDSGNAVLGTDLTVELSRNGGANWTLATLANLAGYGGSYSIVKARANMGGQASGASMTMRIKTLNGKEQRIAAPALYAE
ncbi:MAG: hypothetical protein HZA67_10095 [Rhodospirillales bacterium]|nr:hypothetical protein [Rhodospirillales bacterium]